MNEEELEDFASDIDELQAELEACLQNRQIWAICSLISCVWLIPHGLLPFLTGVALFWFGGKWFKYYALSQITEFEVWQRTVALEELAKLRKTDEEE